MEKLKALLSRKVAGIPVPIIAVVIAGVLAFVAYRTKKASSTTADAVTSDTSPDGTSDGTVNGIATNLPTFDGSNASSVSSPSISTDTAENTDQPIFTAIPTILTPTTPNQPIATQDTNDLWAARCIEYLTAAYGVDVSTSAIHKYLNSETLTSQEAQARDSAIRIYGYPPESIPDTSTAPTPTPPKPVIPATPVYTGPASKQGTPPCTHTVKGTSDNTYSELAILYYGYQNAASDLEIASRNPSHPQGKGLPVGAKIYIPAHVDPKYFTATSSTRTLPNIAKKNGVTEANVQNLNPTTKFPVAAGVKVRVK